MLVAHQSVIMSSCAPDRRMMDRDESDIDLRTIDENILDLLADGRCTRRYLADELGVTGEYVYQRIDLLHKLGLVRIIHDGFYELTEGAE